ncbi:HofP DNA utilization family protein [Erwinia amylovora]
MKPDRWGWPGSLVLLALFSLRSQAERDPFQPPSAVRCPSSPPAAPLWRLRGIVGRAEDYRAWLVSPQGKVNLWAQRQWPDERWQLLTVDALGITAASGLECRTPLRITLKGSLYARDAKIGDSQQEAMDRRTVSAVESAAAANQPGGTASASAARQPGSVVPGVR